MELRSLSVRGLRVLCGLDLETDADLVVITGPNGSGKSSILEGIHLLGTGRSFRSRSVQDLIARDGDAVLVSGQLTGENGEVCRLGVERPRRGPGRMRVDGADVRTAVALARRMPLVVITPESQRLLSDGAEGRRRLLDWLMFHVEPGYQGAHARYRRALRQRNAALRQEHTATEQRAAWCAEMGAAGEALHALREAPPL
jgi:DNA replication and repair protein RecF